MKIGITSRPDLQDALDFTREIIDLLDEDEVFLAPETAEEIGKKGTPVQEMEVDALITVGGDGTVLRNLQKSPNTPILGINMGGRGFLADVHPEEVSKAIKKLRNGELKLVEREKISVTVTGEHLADALNEGVVRSKEPSGILSFRVLVDNEEVEENEGDGIIVSTQTGSTAYALASGGPIIDPNVDAFLAVPLSTHRPRALPLVFPTSSVFKVELLDPGKKAYVTVDGQVTKEAEGGDIISFKKSDNCAKFYDWKGKFYEKMREKL